MNKLDMQSQGRIKSNIEKIKELFPAAVTEVSRGGKVENAVDFEVLKQELSSGLVGNGEEHYQFTWPGKQKAGSLANTSIKKTLRPVEKESVDFDNTQNLYIEGDNLDVLKLLRKTYSSKVKMIYIDPPYNTGNDFVYNDSRVQSKESFEEATGARDEEGNRLVQNTESNGRFHSDWCSMIYPRLKLARDLLSEDGVIFISIDDNEQENLKKICDDVFGAGNFICSFIRQTRKGGGSMSRFVSSDHDYVLMYSKNIASLKKLFLPYGKEYLKRYKEEDDRGKFFWDTFARNRQGSSNFYTIKAPDGTSLTGAWIYKEEKFLEMLKTGDVRFQPTRSGYSVQCKQRISEDGQVMRSLLLDCTNSMGTKSITELLGKDIFTYCKPPELIKHFATAVLKNDDIILDFFSGSATTAHAVMQLNAEDSGHRRFIMVQLPEECSKDTEAYKAGYKNICEIGKERIRRAGEQILKGNPSLDGVLDVGFRVLKLDSSNMEDVYYDPASTKQSDLAISNVKPDRTSLDLLFQAMLEFDTPLSAKIEEEKICGKKVFKVDGGNLVCCFDDGITNELLETIAKRDHENAVFLDSSFADDSVRINCEQLFAKFAPGKTPYVI